MTDYIEVGELMGAHGVRGDLKVKPYNPESELFRKNKSLYLKSSSGFTKHRIAWIKDAPKGLRLHLQGIEDREKAKMLFGQKLYCPREDFPVLDDGEFYLNDIIGFLAIDDESDRQYGKVTGLFETAAHDCFVIDGEKGEILIPAIDEFIVEINAEEKTISFSLPEGLAEVNEG